jgi:CRP-like cAMP-binding protein
VCSLNEGLAGRRHRPLACPTEALTHPFEGVTGAATARTHFGPASALRRPAHRSQEPCTKQLTYYLASNLNNPLTPLATLSQYFGGDYFPLTRPEEEELTRRFTARPVKRRDFLLQAGEVCRHASFVVAGCFRLYAVDPRGKEHNLLFAVENEWMTDLASFYAEQPSRVYIEALEPATVLQIRHDDLLDLFTHYHKLDRNFRILVERAYIALQDRLLQSISAPAEERYENFLAQYPHWARRLPNTQIASYLGMTPEFLSKIRKDRVTKPGKA